MDQEILEELKKLNQNISNRGGFTGNTPSTGTGTGSSSFGKGLDATTGLLKDFGKQINQGGGRLSGATKSIANAFGKGENAVFKFANKHSFFKMNKNFIWKKIIFNKKFNFF